MIRVLSFLILAACTFSVQATEPTACESSLRKVKSEAQRAFMFSFAKAPPVGALEREQILKLMKSDLHQFEMRDLRPFLREALPSIYEKIKFQPLTGASTIIVVFPAKSVPTFEALRTFEARALDFADEVYVSENDRVSAI